MRPLANTLTLKVMAEVVKRCSVQHGYTPAEAVKADVHLAGKQTQPGAVLDGHPRQAKLLSDIASGRRKVGQLETDGHKDSQGQLSAPQRAANQPSTTGPMSLNDWLSNLQRRR